MWQLIAGPLSSSTELLSFKVTPRRLTNQHSGAINLHPSGIDNNKPNIFVRQVRIHHHEIEGKIDDVFRLTAGNVLDTTRHERKWWLKERVEGKTRQENCCVTGTIPYEQCRIADDGTWPILALGSTWPTTRFLVCEISTQSKNKEATIV